MEKVQRREQRGTVLLEGDALIRSATEVDLVAAAAAKAALPALVKISEESEVYTFKERLKTSTKIVKKVSRKRTGAEIGSDDANYNPEHLTDGWACRFVTLFQSDIVDVAREIVKLICHEDKKIKSPFVKNGLVEVIIYTNRPENDPLSISRDVTIMLDKSKLPRSIIRQKNIVKSPENKKSGYSSVHFVVEVPVRVDLPGKGFNERIAKIEIQVRDIFEEAWGEIQHRLVYSDKDIIGHGDCSALEEFWKPYLNTLKTFADGCSQHASIIKKNSAASNDKMSMPTNENRPINAPEEEMKTVVSCIPTNTASDIKIKVEAAYSALIDAKESSACGDNQAEFLKVADLFRSALAVSGTIAKIQCSDRTIEYQLKMELAHAIFLAHSGGAARDIPQEVLTIYSDILEVYQDDVTALFRYARALCRTAKTLEDYGRTLDLLKRAQDNLLTDRTIKHPHWLTLSVPLQMGYVYWAHARATSPICSRQDQVAFLQKAIDVTDAIIKDVISNKYDSIGDDGLDLRHKIIANSIYYTYDKRLLESDGNIDQAILGLTPNEKSDINKKLKLLQKRPFVSCAERNLSTRDTMMCAFQILGDVAKAANISSCLVNELYACATKRAGISLHGPADVPKHLSASEVAIYHKALAAMRWADER